MTHLEPGRLAAILIAGGSAPFAITILILAWVTKDWELRNFDPLNMIVACLSAIMFVIGVVAGNYAHFEEPIQWFSYTVWVGLFGFDFVFLRMMIQMVRGRAGTAPKENTVR